VVNVALKAISIEEKLCRVFLKTSPKHIRDVVIYVIDKSLLSKFSKFFKDNGSFKERGLVVNGQIQGIQVSVIQGDMGAPNAAILMELFRRCGVGYVFRADVCGTLSSKVPIGSVFIPRNALCGEGTSKCYARKENIAIEEPIPCEKTYLQAIEKLGNRNLKILLGTIWTTDALFCETPEIIREWRQKGADAVDMETSVVYLLGQLFGIQTLAILGVVDRPNSEYDFIQSNKIHKNAHLALELPFDFIVKNLANLLE